MGEFGPGFGGNPSIISPDIFAPEERSVIVEVPILHNVSDATAKWHVQMEIAQGSDPHFVVPLFQGDTRGNREGWFFKPDMIGAPHILNYFPTDGLETTKATTPEDGRAATAIFILVGGDASILVPNHTYLQRSRQTSDNGATWSSWSIAILRI